MTLFDLPLRTGRGYYIAYAPAAAEQPKVRNFVDWLKQEAAELRRAPLIARD